MSNEISVIREILIPLDLYPHLREDEPVGNAVAMLLGNVSADGRHMLFDEALVVDADDKLTGQISVQDILTSFFPSLLSTPTSGVFAGKQEPLTDLSILLEGSFQRECRRQAAQKVAQHMSRPHRSIDGAMHPLHALEIMVKDGVATLPVTENGVLLGAVRMTDIFRVLGTYCTI